MPSLVQIIACRLFCAKPLFEPMLVYCQLETNFSGIQIKIRIVHSRKCILRCAKWPCWLGLSRLTPSVKVITCEAWLMVATWFFVTTWFAHHCQGYWLKTSHYIAQFSFRDTGKLRRFMFLQTSTLLTDISCSIETCKRKDRWIIITLKKSVASQLKLPIIRWKAPMIN